VFDAAGKKEIAEVAKVGLRRSRRGEYRVKVRQYNSTVDWNHVTVKPGEVVKPDASGVEFAGRTAEKARYSWHAFDAEARRNCRG
jgi:hypothetical protein